MDRYAILHYNNNKEKNIHLPIEIFKDFTNDKFQSSSHIAFGYSYYYLINYLYRFAKYSLDIKMTQGIIKEILGYASNNKRLDYITKKGGILDSIGYTTTITDYPIKVEFDGHSLDFIMWSDYKQNNMDELRIMNLHNDRNFKIKYPKKAFYRNDIAFQNRHMNGTFYNIKKTHEIPIEAFIKAMTDKDIGTMGFFVYGYIKHKIDVNKGSVKLSRDDLHYRLKIGTSTLNEYILILEDRGFLKVVHQDYWNNKTMVPNEYRLPD